MESGEQWDRYVSMARDYLETGDLEKDEISYKKDIGMNTAAARQAVLNNDDNWADLLKEALRPNHPISWRALYDFNQWCNQRPAEASEALKKLWMDSESTLSVTDRIRAFCEILPTNSDSRYEKPGNENDRCFRPSHGPKG